MSYDVLPNSLFGVLLLWLVRVKTQRSRKGGN